MACGRGGRSDQIHLACFCACVHAGAAGAAGMGSAGGGEGWRRGAKGGGGEGDGGGASARAEPWEAGPIMSSRARSSRRGNSRHAGGWRPQLRKPSTSTACTASTMHPASSTQNAILAALHACRHPRFDNEQHHEVESDFTIRNQVLSCSFIAFLTAEFVGSISQRRMHSIWRHACLLSGRFTMQLTLGSKCSPAVRILAKQPTWQGQQMRRLS